MNFPVEEIPDQDKLFVRIHKVDFRDGKVVEGAFKFRGEGDAEGLSSDWEKYSTSEETRLRARKPADNAVVEFRCRSLREIGMKVLHAPLENNRAHCNARTLDIKYRARLCRMVNDGCHFRHMPDGPSVFDSAKTAI